MIPLFSSAPAPPSTNRRAYTSALVLLLALGLLGLGNQPVSAQQTQQSLLQRLDDRTGNEGTRFSQTPSAHPTKALQGKAIGGITEIGQAQSWALNENTNPDLNFNLTGTPMYAGDVNDDGVTDYLYNGYPRDETTAALEDRTGKTALYYGGTPGQSEDQLLYVQLHPVGDLNNDGHDDALRLDAGSARIYKGSASGYQDTGETLSFSTGTGSIRGFADLDGDGIDDVLIGDPNSNSFVVVYGASSFSSVTPNSYTPQESGEYFAYTLSDIDETGRSKFVRLASSKSSDEIEVQVFDLGSRTLGLTKSFVPEEISGNAKNFRVSAVDVDGTQGKELIVARYQFQDADTPGGFTLAFKTTTPDANNYQATPVALSNTYAIPVGDLDENGQHDFLTFEGSTGNRYISFGPSTLSNGLSFDTQIPQNGNDLESQFASLFLPHGGFGDVTGDGKPDVVLNYESFDYSNLKAGRRFFSVNTDQTARTPTDVTYPMGNFYDRIYETNEIGDFNNDGITDFAIVRYQTGAVNIFFGGSSISSTPDLTIDPPKNMLSAANVTSGDFNGDGKSDLLVAYDDRPGQLKAIRNDIYFGGNNPDATSDYHVTASDVGFPLHLPRAIGDVNDDGATDWMASDRGFNSDYSASGQNVAIFFGEPDQSALPTTPDQTLQYADGKYLGEVKAGVGDVNGDGIDDFAFNNTNKKQVEVYYGGSSPTFSTPADLTLPSTTTYTGVTGGDFNGDGESDIAVLPYLEAEIRLFYGGSDIDAKVDQSLPVPTGVGGGDDNNDGVVDYSLGVLESPGDIDGNGADELIHGSSFLGFGTHALLYHPVTGNKPLRVFRAPNTNASLGSAQYIWSAAMGDFTGNGTVDFVATQFSDENDASQSSRVYRYPVSLVSGSDTKTVSDGSSQQNFSGTGTSISFGSNTSTTDGSGSVTVKKYDGGPASPDGIPSGDNVSSYRVVIDAQDIDKVGSETEVRFDVSKLGGIDDPNNVDIYKRSTAGTGSFTELATSVDDQGTDDTSDDELYATISSFSEFAFGSSSESLPVELAEFAAQLDGNEVHLSWQTASETDNAGFRVQRRTEDASWTTLDQVGGTGTTVETQSYRYTDADLPYEANTLTYRLKQVDTDGSINYSEPMTVERGIEKVELKGTYPNPARQRATVRYALPGKTGSAQHVTIRLFDVMGRQVKTLVDDKRTGRHKQRVDVSTLSSGVYFLRLQTQGKTRTAKLTVVQ